MSGIGRILGRLFAVAFAYVVACGAAGLTYSASLLLQWFLADSNRTLSGEFFLQMLFVAGMVASIVATYAFAPSVIAIVVAEVFRFRRSTYYVLCGGLIGALSYVAAQRYGSAGGDAPLQFGPLFTLYVVGGIIGGLVYWGFAGRSAGVLTRPAA